MHEGAFNQFKFFFCDALTTPSVTLIANQTYAIVYDLPVDDSGEQYTIVLKKWLHEKENIIYLSYPGTKEYNKALRLKRNADKLWSVSSVALVGYYDSYDEAKEKENRLLEYKSSSEAEDSQGNRSLRKQIKSARNDDFVYEDSLSPLPLPSSHDIEIEDMPVVMIPPNIDQVDHAKSGTEPMITNETVYTLLQNIYSKIIKCDMVLQSHTDRLIAIEQKLNILPAHNEVPLLAMELPLKTIDELQQFEEKLDDPQSDALFHTLRRISGSNERTTIFKMLAKVFDHELATICSWKGRKSNHRIDNLKLIKVMLDAIRDSYPNIKDNIIEQAGIDWFRSAQQRLSRLINKK